MWPKVERARWLAHFGLEGEVDEYRAHATELEKQQVSVENWVEYDRATKDLKLEHLKRSK